MAVNPTSPHQCYTELSSKSVYTIKQKLSARAIILHMDND